MKWKSVWHYWRKNLIHLLRKSTCSCNNVKIFSVLCSILKAYYIQKNFKKASVAEENISHFNSLLISMFFLALCADNMATCCQRNNPHRCTISSVNFEQFKLEFRCQEPRECIVEQYWYSDFFS